MRNLEKNLDAKTGSIISAKIGIEILKSLLKQLMMISESLNLEDAQLFSVKKMIVSNLNNTYNNIKLYISDMVKPDEKELYFSELRNLERVNKASYTRE